VNSTTIGEDGLLETVADFRQAGCDELLFVPCSADIRQVHLLADVLARETSPTTVGGR
jgi:hypothetical protein